MSPPPLPRLLCSAGADGAASGPAAIAGRGQPPLPGFPALQEPWPPRFSVPGPEPPISPPLPGCSALLLPGPLSLCPPPVPPPSFPSPLLPPRLPVPRPKPRRCGH